MTVKVALVNFWSGFSFEKTVTYRLLSRHFNIITSDDSPDFVLASCMGDVSAVLKYKCPRILFIGEPMSPDFTLFDYAVGPDFLSIPDSWGKNRFFRFPVAFWEWHFEEALAIEALPSEAEARSALRKKTHFCDFIYGYQTADLGRENVLRIVEKYKHVSCAGTFLNNMPNKTVVKYRGAPSKIEFISNSKFSIAGENMRYPGHVTEKIVDAFFARSIPIYYGDPLVALTFNSEAFLNAAAFESEEALINEISRLDNDDDAYVKILRAPKYAPTFSFSSQVRAYEDFLIRVFSQDSSLAFRRPRLYFAQKYEESLLRSSGHSLFMRVRRKAGKLIHHKRKGQI